MIETIDNKKIIPLDDARAEFQSKSNNNLYNENDTVLSSSVGKMTDESHLNEVEETINALENSIGSIAPKVPIIPEKKIEKIKLVAREKLAKKTVREELKDFKFDENPELANLENTIVLNAEVLKQGLVHSNKKRNEDKVSKKGIVVVIVLFVILILFALTIPFLVNYI